MDLPGRALLPGLRITYDLAFDRKCEASQLRSSIAAASLSSAKTVPHLENSALVVNMTLLLS